MYNDSTAADELEDLQECRTLEGIRIVKIGRGHYRAHSQSSPETAYDVNLFALDGLGSCTCTDFEARRKPRWRMVRKKYNCFRCKHLRAVRDFELDAIIGYFSKKEQEESARHPEVDQDLQ